jgi:hypothetical protein
LLITFPMEFLWFAREALGGLGKAARPALAALWLMQLLTSLSFLQFIRVNRGSPAGDYGDSYRSQLERGEVGLPEVDALLLKDMAR